MKQSGWRLGTLARRLSKLQGFTKNDPRREQVETPADEAAKLLWEAFSRGDVVGKSVVDLGCGTGILSVGAALLGAKAVTGVDIDSDALAVARANAEKNGVEVKWIRAEVPKLPPLSADTVLMNPPFGVQNKGAVTPFLKSAMELVRPGGGLYFFAGPGSQRLIENLALAEGVKVEEYQRFTWPFLPVFEHHTEMRGKLEVDRWVLRKSGK